jgi:hypothetical protein
MKEMLISEVLDLANKQTDPQQVSAVLKQHNSLGLRDVLRASLDDSIVWNLPTGAPKYESSENHTDGTVPSNLIVRTGELVYMVKGGQGDGLHPARRENLFIALLEGIHPRDSEMLILSKDKKLNEKWPNVTKEAVKLAFPKLIAK